MAVDTLRMPTQPFSAVLVGDESLLVRCAELLLSRGHGIRAIVTQSADVRAFAKSNKLTCHDDPRDLLKEADLDCDFLFSIANLRILPQDVVALPRSHAINFHDGPLPSFSGLHATTWAIAAGCDTHAVTWHLMGQRVDAGPIVAERTFSLSPEETAFSLNTRCYEEGLGAFTELVAAIETGTLEATAQTGKRTLFRRHHRPPHGGLLLPAMSAVEQERMVRALDFGPYDNPIGLARLPLRDALFVTAASISDEHTLGTDGQPGTILRLSTNGAVVSTADGSIVYEQIVDLDGRKSPAGAALRSRGLAAGDSILQLGTAEVERFAALDEAAIRNEIASSVSVRNPLLMQADRVIPGLEEAQFRQGTYTRSRADLARLCQVLNEPVDEPALEATGAATVAVFLGKLGNEIEFDLGLSEGSTVADDAVPDYTTSIPARFSFVNRDLPVSEIIRGTAAEIRGRPRPLVLRRDIRFRRPSLPEPRAPQPGITLQLGNPQNGGASQPPDFKEGLRVTIANGDVSWQLGGSQRNDDALNRLAELFDSFVRDVTRSPDTVFQEVSVCPPSQRAAIMGKTTDNSGQRFLLHEAIEAGLGDDAGRIVATWPAGSLAAGELVNSSDELAAALQARGVGPGSRVGVCAERDGDLLNSVLGVLKSGAAYVPIDATLPLLRRRQVVEDADTRFVVCSPSLAELFDDIACTTLNPSGDAYAGDEAGPVPDSSPAVAAPGACTPDDPAYVIYTSGSTGEPKGVVVRHRNVGNFFVGMDDAIGSDTPGRWLAVTSLSFDISILELFWSLSRGFDIVLHSPMKLSASLRERDVGDVLENAGPVDFSLFFFSSNESTEPGPGAYRLLLDSARFADEHNFKAVWTPERHFHAFGGLFPNPAVIGAALASQTQHIEIRAGSCVSPLHHPVRIAEEWSVVDNLSDGRVGIAFAAGWQPHDFVLMPGNYADRKRIMYDQVEIVRGLWRGESLPFANHEGEPVAVTTLPRPVQQELPVWITAAGNPDTFRKAGEAGYNILTHLLGQSVEELGEKVEAYRAGRAASGLNGPGYVSAMVHTFVHPDAAFAERTVREPLKAYLRSAIGLVKDAAWSFPTFKEKTIDSSGRFTLDHLSAEDVDAILDHAFERYYQTSGLFGTPKNCEQMVARLVDAGVTDIACLIDFGIDEDVVMGGLKYLSELKDRVQSAVSRVPADRAAARHTPREARSVSGAILANGITHLQCTPSLARMIIAEPDSQEAFAQLEKMLIGGEALPASLARQVREMVGGDLYNMYGPTETTIWSTTDKITKTDNSVAIGRPIANTLLYLTDRDGQRVPDGYPGELLIGGASVASGYLNRDTETEARFFSDPFSDSGIVYATGDRCVLGEDGRIRFIGRTDGQVKVNGYRIELGDVEQALASIDLVSHAVARVTDRSGAMLIEAFYVAEQNTEYGEDSVREALEALLPEYAIPSVLTRVESLPLTVNGKIDRSRLGDLATNKRRHESHARAVT